MITEFIHNLSIHQSIDQSTYLSIHPFKPVLPEVRAVPGSTPQAAGVGKGGSGSEEEAGERGREELRDEEVGDEGGEEEAGEEGEVSMGVGPLE